MPDREPPEQSRNTDPAETAGEAVPKIVLASEALREDLAPLRPAAQRCRVAMCGVALALSFQGLALHGGLGFNSDSTNGSSLAFASAGALLAIAALPFPYLLRATVACALGFLLMVAGAEGVGPLGGLASDGALLRDIARLAAMCGLPAALLFRAKYRIYRPARFVLAAAMVLASPFLAIEALLLADSSAPFATRAGGAVDVITVLSALSGFMGGYTTGAGTVLAAVLLWVLAADLALRDLTPLADPELGHLVYTTTALGILAASILVSLGIFQILSGVLASDARTKTATAKRESDAAPSAALDEPKLLR